MDRFDSFIQKFVQVDSKYLVYLHCFRPYVLVIHSALEWHSWKRYQTSTSVSSFHRQRWTVISGANNTLGSNVHPKRSALKTSARTTIEQTKRIQSIWITGSIKWTYCVSHNQKLVSWDHVFSLESSFL